MPASSLSRRAAISSRHSSLRPTDFRLALSAKTNAKLGELRLQAFGVTEPTSGTDTLSLLKIAHVITTLEVEPGTNWLFRLDSVTSAAGRITPRHRHKGPGIRCLYQGTFNVQGQAYPTENMAPGDAWWESGEETIVAWHSNQMPAIFIRGLLLPPDTKGDMSNIWETKVESPQSNWRLLIDQEITI